ncbi:unnamed protein product [Dicrocoelium dendriticum]|nr:unnamed protein product [Dicrocoelium dendriticum]
MALRNHNPVYRGESLLSFFKINGTRVEEPISHHDNCVARETSMASISLPAKLNVNAPTESGSGFKRACPFFKWIPGDFHR